MEQHVRIKDEQDRGHGAALAEAPGLEVVVGCDIVDKGGVLGLGVESTDQVDQPRRHSIVVEDPTEGGVGNAVKGLVKIYVKMVGLGASGDFCRDVEKGSWFRSRRRENWKEKRCRRGGSTRRGSDN